MYTVNVSIEGVAPMMQHRFPVPDIVTMGKGGRKQTGATDYTQEWREYLYVNPDGVIYQPASQVEGSMSIAAGGFKVSGNLLASYRVFFKFAVFVLPEEITHNIKAPESLDTDADKALYLDMRPVVVQRNRVVRIRPTFKVGWKLDFEIQVIVDQIPHDIVNEVLTLAGRTVGIGDYRPRFGRFIVTRFEVVK
jgi:hypothetical protein